MQFTWWVDKFLTFHTNCKYQNMIETNKNKEKFEIFTINAN
jgi:hypothetical protein